MAKMEVEQKTILEYLSKNTFLIPLYQRAYVWDIAECEQLYEDILGFFEGLEDEGQEVEEYFLGSIVTYENQDRHKGMQSIIDGQQRTTTLMLFLRALFEKTNSAQNPKLHKLSDTLASCLWELDFFSGEIHFNSPHLISEVATERDKDKLAELFSENPPYLDTEGAGERAKHKASRGDNGGGGGEALHIREKLPLLY